MKQFAPIIIFIVVVLFNSCDNKTPDESIGVNRIDSSDIEVFEFPIKKFSLPYGIPINCDSNSLIYLNQTPFDTSYFLHVSKRGQDIIGVCYMVPQSYHRDLEDFSDREHQLLFFDGMSFKLDSRQWQMLKRETIDVISKISDSSRTNSPCFDCPTYVIMFNNKKRATGSKSLPENFKIYDTFIRDSLINYFLVKKGLR